MGQDAGRRRPHRVPACPMTVADRWDRQVACPMSSGDRSGRPLARLMAVADRWGRLLSRPMAVADRSGRQLVCLMSGGDRSGRPLGCLMSGEDRSGRRRPIGGIRPASTRSARRAVRSGRLQGLGLPTPDRRGGRLNTAPVTCGQAAMAGCRLLVIFKSRPHPAVPQRVHPADRLRRRQSVTGVAGRPEQVTGSIATRATTAADRRAGGVRRDRPVLRSAEARAACRWCHRCLALARVLCRRWVPRQVA
jgi:hypothetical protein